MSDSTPDQGGTERWVVHLEMIQGVINRLSSSSAAIKGLTGTIAAAAIALYGTISVSQWIYLLAAAVPVSMFWILDSRYLQTERAFRNLYDCVRVEEARKTIEPFSMDYKRRLKNVPGPLKLMFTWSLAWFYLSILVSLALIFVGTYNSCSPPKAG
jgi:hypothetical protein